jgi:hypothetical protein
MDTLQRYAGYAVLGLVGGYIAGFLMLGIGEGNWDPIETLDFFIPYFLLTLIAIFGGILGGVITKKWWGLLSEGLFFSLHIYSSC